MAEQDYVTVRTAAEYFGPGHANPSHDARIERAVTAASRSVDAFCGRRFWRDDAPVVRMVKPRTTGRLVLAPRYELAATPTSVTYAGMTWVAGTDYEANPLENIGPTGEPWPILALEALGTLRWSPSHAVSVTGIGGWPEVPAAVSQATLIIAAQLWKLSEAPLGVAGFGEYGAMRVRSNPVAADLLMPYAHGGGLV